MASRTNTPAIAEPAPDSTNSGLASQQERATSPAPDFGGYVAAEIEREKSPAPDFGGRVQNNTSALSAEAAAAEHHAKAFKRGDAIGIRCERPTN